MRKKTLLAIRCIAGTLFLATGCLEHPNSYVKVPCERFFDFNLSQKINLAVDCGFNGKSCPALLEHYNQNPMEENKNMELIRKETEPAYRTSTDNNGKLSDEIQTLSVVVEV